VKIIDRVKAYIRQKKGRDRSSTGYPLDGAADPAPAQRDRAGHKQNRDDKAPAVSTAHETPEPEPATEPTTEPATESATDPITEPTAEPATEPTTAPAACPRCGATGEAPCTTPSGKATKTHKGREQ
jgi:cell division septation protein DedD